MQLPAPDLQQALAVALLLKKRCAAAVGSLQARCEALQGEVEQLRAAAARPLAPRPPQPPLLALLEGPDANGPPPATPPPSRASPQTVQHQLQALVLWHKAAAALPLDLLPTLAAAQRYLLLREQRSPSPAPLPMWAALDRSPVVALLEVTVDVLQTHAAAAVAAPPGEAPATDVGTQQPAPPQPGAPPPRPQQLSAAHGQLLLSACSCLVHLCDHHTDTASPSDFEALHQFGAWVLELACCSQPAAGGSAGLAVATPDQQPTASDAGVAGAATPAASEPEAQLLQQAPCVVAQRVLAALRQSPSAGLVLLHCTAPLVRDCMAALVYAVNSQPPLPLPSLPWQASGGSGSSAPSQAAAAAGAEEEERLLHAFTQLSCQLSAGLALLPQWSRHLQDDGRLQARRA